MTALRQPPGEMPQEATQRILNDFEVPDVVFGGLGEWRLDLPHPKIALTALDGLTGAPVR